MILSIAVLLFLVTPLAQVTAYQYLGCNKGSGPIAQPDAVHAIELIPSLELIPVPGPNNPQGPPLFGGRLTLNVPDAAHQVRPPVVFHYGHVIIEVEETDLRRGGRTPGTLSRTEESFYLWVEARTKALTIMARCVRPTDGQYGGWARFSVVPRGQPERQFRIHLKKARMVALVLANRRARGYAIWPALGGAAALPPGNPSTGT